MSFDRQASELTRMAPSRVGQRTTRDTARADIVDVPSRGATTTAQRVMN